LWLVIVSRRLRAKRTTILGQWIVAVAIDTLKPAVHATIDGRIDLPRRPGAIDSYLCADADRTL
jgi:hypothetical protein